VEFRVLGPLVVTEEGRELPLGWAKQRAVLAVLLLHANEVVTTDRLVAALWGSDAPTTARTALQGHVSRLRKIVGRDRLRTHGAGYVLEVAPEELDLARFERLVADARAADDPGVRRALLGEALSLWRGRPLPEFEGERFARAEIERLEELRLGALEERIDAELALGRHADLVGELERLVSRAPRRERLRGQLMVALYRSGRQAEALDVYRQGRAALAEELGLDPGPALQALERRILQQDPALDPAATAPQVAEPTVTAERGALRRRALLAAAVAGAVAAAVSIPIFALGSGRSGGEIRAAAGNDVVEIDPRTNHLIADVPVGAAPRNVVFAAGSLWVANLADRTVSRVDVNAKRVIRTIPALPPATPPTALSAGSTGVWYAGKRPNGTIVVGRIDPRFDIVAKTASLPRTSLSPGRIGMAAGPRMVWLVSGGIGPLSQIDATSGRLIRTVDTRTCCPADVAVAGGAVWVADRFADTVTRINGADLAQTVDVGHAPEALAATPQAVWAVIEQDDALVRIDPATNAVQTRIPVGSSPSAVAVGLGAVWVANSRDGTVSRIDPSRNAVVATIRVGGRPSGIAVGAGTVWVSVQEGGATGKQSRKAGGVAHVNTEEDLGSLDPALAYAQLEETTLEHGALAWQIEYATCAKLLNYPDRPAPFGSELVPEVAEALPSVSVDRKTYTFRIRRSFKFSPPSAAPVTAATFKSSIERSLSPRMHGPASLAAVAAGTGARQTLDDVVGAKAYAAGRARHIAGLVARGNTLTITLERPSADLPQRLALPFFCAVPTDTPLDPNSIGQIPAAGPYYISSYAPGQEVVLTRNPNYGGGRARRLDEIRIAIGVARSDTLRQIEAGQADYALDGVPPEAQADLLTRYGPGSPAARAGSQRYFVDPRLALYFLALNTRRPLFADASLRRAVAYAVNRTSLVRLASFLFTAVPTDQYLPPGSLGFQDARLYPAVPDLRRARRLMHGRHGTAVLYTLTSSLPVALLMQAFLEPIGIHVDIRTFSIAQLRERLGRKGEPFDLTVDGWSADTPDPAAMLVPLLDGSRIRAVHNTDIAYFDESRYNRRLDAAARLTGSRRYRAYGALDVQIARDAAPYIALANPARVDFFSSRMGCEVDQPVYGVDLAALCVR